MKIKKSELRQLIREEIQKQKTLLTESTRSRIGVLDPKTGKVKSIYSHFDGYLDGVGKTLKKHYTDSNKVKKLISLGDISILGPKIGKKQNFNKPDDDSVLAYGRDRGEKNVDAKINYSVRDYLRSLENSGVDYAYLYDPEEKKWKYMKRPFNKNWEFEEF